MLYFMQISLSHTSTNFHCIGIKNERQVKCQRRSGLKTKQNALLVMTGIRPPVRHFSGELKWESKTAQRKVGV